MASASHNHSDGDHDTVPLSPPHKYDTVLSSVANDQEQIPVENIGDWRDDRETSLSSDEDGEGVQILTERQAKKRPQSTQEIPMDRAQPPTLITREDI
ncbi:hypothetical protein A2U01_0063051, partial [Trifolium medium]|nr:hypothetical protein [Trifolium medium]